MDSFILEDVKTLIRLKKGDSTRLEHIKELCETNQIISLSDRKYIDRLSSQYLQKFEKPQEKKPEKPKFKPVEEPPKPSTSADVESVTERPAAQLKEVQIPKSKPQKPASPNLDFLTNKKLIYAAGAIVAGLIIATIAAVGLDDIEFNSGVTTPPPIDPDVPFSLTTDESSYEASDIISISGKLKSPTGETVRVSIENAQGTLIWAENLNLKSSGEFSTLAIAGGEGWENSGDYTLIAEHEGLTEQLSFEFDS